MSTVRKVHFSVSGDFVTNHARERWVSDDPHSAVDFLLKTFDTFTEDLALEVITGKKRLEGVNDMHLEDDDVTEMFGIPLDIPTMIERIEKRFIENQNKIIDARQRLEYFGNIISSDGADYRSGEGVKGMVFTKEYDENILIICTEKNQQYIRGLKILYPRVGLDLSNLPLDKCTGCITISHILNPEGMYFISDIEPNEFTDKAIKESDAFQERFSKDSDTAQEMVDEAVVKAQEAIERLKNEEKGNTLKTPFGAIKVEEDIKEERQPDEISDIKPEFGSGWLLPDGKFYLDYAIAWIHVHILDQLEEDGFFEDKDYRATEESVQEEGGWVKISGYEWMLYHKLNTTQVQAILEYTIAIGRDHIRTGGGYERYTLEEFSELLNEDADRSKMDWTLKSLHDKVWGKE